ncbi:MAG: hypothetical protein AB1705_13175 [Verrucomicrobiota bacterium]
MQPPLPPEIRVAQLRQGVRYELPRRNLGPLGCAAIFLIGFGLFFSGFAVFWIIGASLATAKNGVFGWLFPLFGLPFFFIGLVPIALGLFMTIGRCTIELDGLNLRVIERAGPFRWTRKCHLENVRRLAVQSSPTKVNNQPVTTGPPADLASLTAESNDCKPMPLVLAYPRGWLLALSHDLAQRTNLAGLTGEGAPDVVEVKEGASVDSLNAERREPPPGCTVRVENKGDAVMLTIPPAGLVKGSKGLFVFGLIWCAFIGIVTAVVLLADGSKSKDIWVAWIIFPLFWLVGLGMLLGGANMGQRRALLLANPRELRVAQKTLFGTKQFTWPREQLARVELGPSGMTVNNVPVNELQIHTTDGAKKGFFSERDDEELRWIATTLRDALQLR